MKFNFRFASVLKLRRHEEKKEKQKLGILVQQKAELEEALHELEKKCRQETETSSETKQQNRQHYVQMHAMHKRLVDLRQQVSKIEENISRQKRKLAEANKQTRIMEKLKQKEKRAFVERIEELEQLQQNEIALQRYNAN